MAKAKPTKELKAIYISEAVHSKLKVHVAKKKIGITPFADAAILEKLKSDK